MKDGSSDAGFKKYCIRVQESDMDNPENKNE